MSSKKKLPLSVKIWLSAVVVFVVMMGVRRRQLLPELALAFAPPQRSKLYQLLHKFIPV